MKDLLKKNLALNHVQVFPFEDTYLKTSQNKIISKQNFHKNIALKNFLPAPNKLTFSYLQLKKNEQLKSIRKIKRSVLIAYQGEAWLTNKDRKEKIQAGDSILIPPHCSYAIENREEDNFQAILLDYPAESVELKNQSSNKVNNIDFDFNYDGLINYNNVLLEKVLKNPYFTMLKSNRLNNSEARQNFLNHIQVFSDYFQLMLFARQASCLDPAFSALFLEHLREELGHDQLLAARKSKKESKDIILHATSMWFCNQMLVLDNLEKTALMHLVLEVSGDHYHQLAKEKLGVELESNYYEVHNELDDHHAKMGINLLQGHSPAVYQRLQAIIYKGWSMLDAMTRRVAELVEPVLTKDLT